MESFLAAREVLIQPSSKLAGATLADSPIRRELDVLVVGIRRNGDDIVFNPASTQLLDPGDTLLVMGHPQNLRRLEQIADR